MQESWHTERTMYLAVVFQLLLRKQQEILKKFKQYNKEHGRKIHGSHPDEVKSTQDC